MKRRRILTIWLALFWSCVPALTQETQKLDLYLETGHVVISGAFSDDGKTMVSWGNDRTLKLWDVESGRELDNIKEVSNAIFSPDNKTVALVVSKTNMIRLWDINTWREQRILSWSGDALMTSVIFPNSQTIVASDYQRMTMWNAVSGDELFSLKGQGSGFSPTFLSPDSRIVARHADGKVILLDATSGHIIHTLGQETKYFTAIFSPDNKTIASWNETKLTLWDVVSGRPLHTISTDTFNSTLPQTVIFSPNGKIIAIYNHTRLRLWNTISGQELTGLGGTGICNVSFSLDEKTIFFQFGLLANIDQPNFYVALWEVGSVEPPRVLKRGPDFLSAIFSPDSKTVAIGTIDGFFSPESVRLAKTTLWDVHSRVQLTTLNEPSTVLFSKTGKPAIAWVAGGQTMTLLDPSSWREIGVLSGNDSPKDVGYSLDGKLILSFNDKALTVWDSESRQRVQVFETSIGPYPRFMFSPDKRTVAFISDVSGLWDLTTGRQVSALTGKAIFGQSFRVSPDGKTLTTWSGYDKIVLILWDLASKRGFRTVVLNDVADKQHHAPGPNASMLLPITLSVAISPDEKIIATSRGYGNTVTLWDAASGRRLHRLVVEEWIKDPVVFSERGNRLAFSNGKQLKVWDTTSGALLQSLPAPDGKFAFSPDGQQIASADANFRVKVWDITSDGKPRSFAGHTNVINAITFAPDGKTIASASSDQTIKLWNARTGQVRNTLITPVTPDISVAFSTNGQTMASGTINGTTNLWNTASGKLLKTLQSKELFATGEVYALVPDYFIKNPLGPVLLEGRFEVKSGESGWINLLDKKSDAIALSLIALVDGEWVVTTPEGRFDTNKPLDRIEGLHWVINKEIFRPLSLELFMRQYYEPRLMPRVFANDDFREVPPLAEINQVQPKVTIVEAQKDGPETAMVTVDVENGERAYEREKNPVIQSGAKDLRLFRDGLLVNYRDGELLGQQQSVSTGCEPIAGSVKKCRAVFKQVRLPRQDGVKEVEFSAYAFNTSDVKSETVRYAFPYTTDLPTRKGRLYLVSVGVSKYENPAWNLEFAANDAHLVLDTVAAKLRATREYDDVVEVLLTSEGPVKNGQKPFSNSATRDNFHKLMRLLAGEKLNAGETAEIPNAEKINRAMPEDVVLIFYSSHGYRDQERFYLFTYDTGAGEGRDPEAVVPHSISSDDLYLWLRDIDAGDIVLVIDACHAAAITGKEFKPGPMASRGMGQLTYDKGIRILAATQPDTTAAEVNYIDQKRRIQHGLLIYALVQQGLIERQADSNADSVILMTEWLEYGVRDVPRLYQDVMKNRKTGSQPTAPRSQSHRANRVRFISKGVGDIATQQPTLFDFRDKLRRRRQLPVYKILTTVR